MKSLLDKAALVSLESDTNKKCTAKGVNLKKLSKRISVAKCQLTNKTEYVSFIHKSIWQALNLFVLNAKLAKKNISNHNKQKIFVNRESHEPSSFCRDLYCIKIFDCEHSYYCILT